MERKIKAAGLLLVLALSVFCFISPVGAKAAEDDVRLNVSEVAIAKDNTTMESDMDTTMTRIG